jgi:uncharacterized protein YbbC (DUF1343 family)
LAGVAADGERISTTHDPRTGIPIYSLYGDNIHPSADALTDIDVMVCDIQDIGVRYYTFLWTVTHIVEACGENNIPVVILDRPNPLGDTVAGSPLLPEYLEQLSEKARLVGRYDIPIQHGMTLGELVMMLNDTENDAKTDVTVIFCEGWQRSMTWDAIGKPFVAPSPNMPHFVTVQHYPGACLIEGTTLSEGRGTALPFEIVGAPFINSHELAKHLNAPQWQGVKFRPHTFQPTASKWQGQVCEGVHVHITNQISWQPLEVWLGIIRAIRQLYPNDFEWLPPLAGEDISHFDRLIGSRKIRQQIDDNVPIAQITQDWGQVRAEFLEQRKPYLLY